MLKDKIKNTWSETSSNDSFVALGTFCFHILFGEGFGIWAEVYDVKFI